MASNDISDLLIDKDLGPVSAYAMAVEAGYTGTEEQFAEDLANAGQNVQAVTEAAQQAAAAASRAADAAATASAAYNTDLLAVTFDQTESYTKGKHVIYSGKYYVLPNGHDANVTWENTTKTEEKVGNEISDLKSAFVASETIQITNVSVTDGRYINQTGGTATASNSGYTDPIPVTPGDRVTLSGLFLTGVRSVCAYRSEATSSFEEVLVSGTEDTSATFTIPDGSYYIRATTTSGGTVTGQIVRSTAKLVEKYQGTENAGKALLIGNDGYVVPGEVNTDVDDTLSHQGEAADAKATGDAIGEINAYIKHEETNALSIETIDGSYIAGDGVRTTNANSAYTDYFPVTGGAEITLNNVSLNSLKAVVAYSNNVQSAAQKERLDDGTVLSGTFTTTLPTWAKYVRASTAKGAVITGTEHIVINYVDKAIEDAAYASQVAEEAEETLNGLSGIVSGVISESMMKTACRAVLTRPSGLTLTGLDDITVFATAASYGVTAQPKDYMNVVGTAIYIDAVNGNDANAGTQASPKETITAAISAGANTVYLSDGIYTFPSGGISQNINLIGMGDSVVISNGAYFTGNITIYVERIDFDGGEYPCLVEVGAATETPQFCAYKCTFENATTYNGLSIKGEATVRVFDCVAKNNFHDGFNYHKNTSISPASGAPNVLECGCEAYGNGDANSSPTSDNGTTAHNYTQIIRVGGNYHDNHGGNIADNGNVKAWTVGCSASGSQKTTGDVNNADFWINASAVMYCDNCYASGSTFDGWAESSSTLYVAGGEIENMHTDGTSSKQTYTSEAVFKYLAG